MDQKWDHMKMNFEYFQIQKWITQTVIAEKVDDKNGAICLVFMFPAWVMVCKLSIKVHFLQFFADLIKKPKSVKAISLQYTFSENAMIYRVLSQCLPFTGHPPFRPFWSVRYLNFWLLTMAAHCTFLEGRHSEVTESLYYVLTICQSKIPIFLGSSSWTKMNLFHSLCCIFNGK